MCYLKVRNLRNVNESCFRQLFVVLNWGENSRTNAHLLRETGGGKSQKNQKVETENIYVHNLFKFYHYHIFIFKYKIIHNTSIIQVKFNSPLELSVT